MSAAGRVPKWLQQKARCCDYHYREHHAFPSLYSEHDSDTSHPRRRYGPRVKTDQSGIVCLSTPHYAARGGMRTEMDSSSRWWSHVLGKRGKRGLLAFAFVPATKFRHRRALAAEKVHPPGQGSVSSVRVEDEIEERRNSC